MIETKFYRKEKPLNRREYIGTLEKYFDISDGDRTSESEVTLAYLAQRLRSSRKNQFLNQFAQKIVATFVVMAASSFAMSWIFLWGVNKVFGSSIEYSFLNILILSGLYMISKLRVNMSK